MKTVPLKKLSLVRPTGEPTELNYRDYIGFAVKSPMDHKSVDIDEIHKSLRVLAVLDKLPPGASNVDLEDTDYAHLCQKVRAMRFNWVDAAFGQFVDDVINAPEAPTAR